jgi:hypothetical protein
MEETKTEDWLIQTAEQGSDTESKAAMKELRERFDPTYFWCADCDYLVCKLKDCCQNREICPDDGLPVFNI